VCGEERAFSISFFFFFSAPTALFRQVPPVIALLTVRPTTHDCCLAKFARRTLGISPALSFFDPVIGIAHARRPPPLLTLMRITPASSLRVVAGPFSQSPLFPSSLGRAYSGPASPECLQQHPSSLVGFRCSDL